MSCPEFVVAVRTMLRIGKRRRRSRQVAVTATVLVLFLALPGFARPATDELRDGTVGGIEGLSDCFWIGPSRADNFNAGFPDTGASYWFARVAVPDGAMLELDGVYPRARYFSFHAYERGAAPYDHLTDVTIVPRPGSTNPFLPGAARDTPDSRRRYRIRVLAAERPASLRASNTLYLGAARERYVVPLIWRVYVPDQDTDDTGNAGLPRVTLVLADGARLRGESMCRMLGSPPLGSSERVTSVPLLPADRYITWRDQAGADALHPARAEPVWEKFFNSAWSLLRLQYADPDALAAARAEASAVAVGGYLGNRDASYLSAYVDRRLGEVLVVSGTAPTAPATRAGARVFPRGDLRYWSLCMNESAATTRVMDCLFDEQIPRRSGGGFVVAIGLESNRPNNAGPECGTAWLRWSEHGDTLGRDTFGLLILRHILPAAQFRHSIGRVRAPGEEASTMGTYLPDLRYLSRREFEAMGCSRQ
jgi:hypothetical protein